MNPALIAIIIQSVLIITWFNERTIAKSAMESRAG